MFKNNISVMMESNVERIIELKKGRSSEQQHQAETEIMTYDETCGIIPNPTDYSCSYSFSFSR